MIRLSICIPTYNQVNILRKNIENLLQYPGDDIQIVVSDNGSSDDIAGMLANFHDPRIKHCRLPENVGQDRNILNAFRNCDCPYAFLLRTKDTLLPEQIPAVIRTAEAHPNVGYWRFNCVDEEGRAQGNLPTAIYRRGAEAAQAQEHIMIHPSGELYNLAFLQEADYAKLDAYMVRYFGETNLGFVVHVLLRMQLSARSEIGTSEVYAWIYLSGKASVQGTVNNARDSKSVYAPEYAYPRYACEMDYVEKELPPELHLLLHKKLLRRYCQAVTVAYQYINRDKLSQQHYHCEEQPFSVSAERHTFWQKTLELIQDYPPEEQRSLKRYAVFCLSVMQLRWHASHFLGPLIKEKLMGRLADIRRRR